MHTCLCVAERSQTRRDTSPASPANRSPESLTAPLGPRRYNWRAMSKQKEEVKTRDLAVYAVRAENDDKPLGDDLVLANALYYFGYGEREELGRQFVEVIEQVRERFGPAVALGVWDAMAEAAGASKIGPRER